MLTPLFFFKRVRALLNDMALHMLPTDKDGGYALVPKHVVISARAKILSSGDYVVSPFNEKISSDIYKNVCRSWASALDYPGLSGKLCSSLNCDVAKFHSVLELNCKTHKEPVTFRNLHASTMWRYGALSRFVSNVLQRDLNKHPHIIRDSRDLVNKLSSVKCSATMKFCKLDVDHFFMSGKAHELTNLCVKGLPHDHPTRDPLEQSIYFLLDNQYVLDEASGLLVKVVNGSGIWGSLTQAQLLKLLSFMVLSLR
jgi:hypothetical protein